MRGCSRSQAGGRRRSLGHLLVEHAVEMDGPRLRPTKQKICFVFTVRGFLPRDLRVVKLGNHQPGTLIRQSTTRPAGQWRVLIARASFPASVLRS